jgi:hypothetical protein
MRVLRAARDGWLLLLIVLSQARQAIFICARSAAVHALNTARLKAHPEFAKAMLRRRMRHPEIRGFPASRYLSASLTASTPACAHVSS